MRVDGTHLDVAGDQDFAEVRDIEGLDMETGESLLFDADPERWARNLPQAFRSGDLVCRVSANSRSEATANAALPAGA